MGCADSKPARPPRQPVTKRKPPPTVKPPTKAAPPKAAPVKSETPRKQIEVSDENSPPPQPAKVVPEPYRETPIKEVEVEPFVEEEEEEEHDDMTGSTSSEDSEGIRTMGTADDDEDSFSEELAPPANEDLIHAVEHGKADAVEELLLKGISPNGMNHGMTPLHRAAFRVEKATYPIIRLLVKYDANVNGKDSSGGRPLHSAARQKNPDAVKALLTGPTIADPLAKNRNGETPIHTAASTDNIDTLSRLIDACHNTKDAVTSTTSSGNTPLHLAAHRGRLNSVSVLIELHRQHQVTLDPLNNGGYTPIQEAALEGHTAIVKTLKEAGATYDVVTREACARNNSSSYQIIPKTSNNIKNGKKKASKANSGSGKRFSAAAKKNSEVGIKKKTSGITKANSGSGKQSGTGLKKKAKKTTSGRTPPPPKLQEVRQQSNQNSVRAVAASPVIPTTPQLSKTNYSSHSLKQWQKGRTLGKGAFGSVCEALLRDGSLLAVKLIQFDVEDKKETELVTQEFELIKNLNHINILQYYGINIDHKNSQLQIFMEMAPKGSVASLVKSIGDALSVNVIRNFTIQILQGCHYLHERGIIHRDIKGDNLLIGEGNVIKLADFGSSRQFDNLVTAGKCNTLIGTPLWMAPEVINLDGSQGYNTKADIWSVGITQIEMLNCVPWKNADKETPWGMLFQIGSSNSAPNGIPSDCHPKLHAFMMRCFIRKPDLRPDAGELLSDPFLTCPEKDLEWCC